MKSIGCMHNTAILTISYSGRNYNSNTSFSMGSPHSRQSLLQNVVRDVARFPSVDWKYACFLKDFLQSSNRKAVSMRKIDYFLSFKTMTMPLLSPLDNERFLRLPKTGTRYHLPKNRWVKVAMKLISISRPKTASMDARIAIGSPRLCTGWKKPRP